MSASCAPRLSQLIHAATPDPIKVEKATLREKFIATSMALVAEAKCLLDDKEELWEEKVMWMCRWEQRMGEVFPLIKHGQELGINTKIGTVDGPAMTEADKAYKRWVATEIACGKADEDVWMEEEVTQAVGEQGPSQFESPKQSQQTMAESEDKDEPKIVIPPGSILHKIPCAWCMVKKGCETSNKSAGKKMLTGMVTVWSAKAAKAGSSKWAAAEDDDDKVKVVKSHTHVKGKALVRNWLDAKVHMDQLAKALEKIGVE
ncbi:hypothetical protein M404DRAFT_34758 [Pisolithus tinctorius Marx 270]|uniref:Uncharacterized protein n=1 Tax=Pisolithus tinctorius Marx 270 TaxID=870435 RepID=A0A0C3ICB1_PISTI|nr:hypothetical protein M404DRAFT_34758 [Pisolithus tinctorius Marx 270]